MPRNGACQRWRLNKNNAKRLASAPDRAFRTVFKKNALRRQLVANTVRSSEITVGARLFTGLDSGIDVRIAHAVIAAVAAGHQRRTGQGPAEPAGRGPKSGPMNGWNGSIDDPSATSSLNWDILAHAGGYH